MENLNIATLPTKKLVDVSVIKKGIWLYFYLLIFEGALRKWVIPGLAEPLLLIRDPLALWLMYKAYRLNVWSLNSMSIVMIGITILAFISALLTGHGNLLVAIFGLRITVIHFPLMFLIGHILTYDDVLKLGKTVLWLNIAMTLLVAVQFYSPQTSFINRGLGGTEGSGFSGAAGFFRVPGTFSFTNGLSLFYGFTAAFIFYFWIDLSKVGKSKTILIISTIALLAAIPLSVSRTVLFEIITSVFFMILIAAKRPKIVKKVIGGTIGAIVLLTVLSMFSFFQTATMAFTERFTSASKSEGGIEGSIVDRFLGGLLGAITNADNVFFGMGLGLGTNAGAKLATGSITFLIAEGEWGRLIGEMGLLLGLSMIFIRAAFVFEIGKNAWKAISKDNMLPWMLMSFAFLLILQGQWAQPTALGFSTLMGGIIISAFKKNYQTVIL